MKADAQEAKADDGSKVGAFTRIWLSPVRFYRRFLSPLKGRPTCRYLPTCSEYAIEAVEHHGVFVGSFKAAWRLLRCNPLFAGGYDPVCHQGKCKE